MANQRTEGVVFPIDRSPRSYAVVGVPLNAFTLVEDVGAAGRVGSFFDALWWSSTTITTVGYGDIAPATAAGRLRSRADR